MRKYILALFLFALTSDCWGVTNYYTHNSKDLTPEYSARNFVMGHNSQVVSGFTNGLTFYADYSHINPDASLDAIYFRGSGTPTFTRTACNRTTYGDGGIISLVSSSDIPIFDCGFWDSTGWNSNDSNGKSVKGVKIEESGTNLLIRTDGTSSAAGLWTGWSESHTTAGAITLEQEDITGFCSIPGAYAQRIAYTSAGDANKRVLVNSTATAAGSTLAGETVVYSFFVKLNSYTPTLAARQVSLYEYNAADAYQRETNQALGLLATTAGEWIFIQKQVTLGANTDHVKVFIDFQGIDTGETFDYSFYGFQVEKTKFATTFKPTAATAAAVNRDVLKYQNNGNRTKNQETILAVIVPQYGQIGSTTSRVITGTDTKERIFYIDSLDKWKLNANFTDSPGLEAVETNAQITINKSLAMAGTITHSPSIKLYYNGISNGSDTTPDFTDPSWGSYFYVGSRSSTAGQLNGIIRKIAYWSRELSPSEITSISNMLNN